MGGIELGGIGRVVSIAPLVGKVATPGPIRIGGFPAPKFDVDIRNIANPFLGAPKLPSYIENKGPSILGPKVESIKNPFKAEQGVFSLEKRIIGGINLVKTPEPAIVRLPYVVSEPKSEPRPIPAPQVEFQAQGRQQQKAENSTANRAASSTVAPAVQAVQAEQVTTEKKIELKKEEQSEARERKKQSLVKIIFTEAVKISKNRVSALKRAYQEIKARGLGMSLLVTFLDKSYWEQISPVAKSGYDGTLKPTVEEVVRQQNIDETKIDQIIGYAVANHIPVQEGIGGRVASVGELKEVLEGKEKEKLELQTPAEGVIKTVIEQTEVRNSGEVVNMLEKRQEMVEPTLKDLGIQDLFQTEQAEVLTSSRNLF